MTSLSRRDFIITAAVPFALAGLAETTVAQQRRPPMPFELPPLPYAYEALEPVIDRETMRLHHDKHHQAYVDGVNKALANEPRLAALPLDELLRRLDEVPEAARQAVRNNGGGHANHSMFWQVMGPNGGGTPNGALAQAIGAAFGSFDQLKARFNQAGETLFGSGWVFVTMDPRGGTLELTTRPNQDSPLMEGRRVLFGNDVWEHAYYLKHRNKRPAYLAGWWDAVDWTAVARRFEAIRAGEPVI